MASATYSKLMTTLSDYVGEDKATLALERQLSRVDATQDSLSADDVPKVLNYLMGAVMLYMPDKSKQEELRTKLQAAA